MRCVHGLNCMLANFLLLLLCVWMWLGDHFKNSSAAEQPNASVYLCMCVGLQVEADMGYPGGKAKIIHKESDIIMAFAINKVRTCLSVVLL